MKYIIRKYCSDINNRGNYKTCIGALGKFGTKNEAQSFFWDLQISEFRKNKDFLHNSKFEFDSKFRFEREFLINYINEKYPFFNEYHYPTESFSLNKFKIPDEISDEEIKELSEQIKMYFFEIFEFDKNIIIYVPNSNDKYKTNNNKYEDINFIYYEEGEHGTRAFVHESIARFEIEEYLLNSKYELNRTEINSSYELLELNYEEYLDFRFNELSKQIKSHHTWVECNWGDRIIERLSIEFQLPEDYLHQKLNNAPNTVENDNVS
jgi:hypothetical protein